MNKYGKIIIKEKKWKNPKLNDKHGIVGRPPEKALSLFSYEGIWSSSNFPSFAQTKIK